MNIIRPLIQRGIKPRLGEIQLFDTIPQKIQEEIFFFLLESAKNTEWGKTYKYEEINSIKTFQERVPVSTYEDIEHIINRSRKGEPDLLWPGETEWFAKSSGTTGSKSKFIPVTKDFFWGNHYQGGQDTTSLYLKNNPKSLFYKGKMLILGGSMSENQYGVIEGDISAIMINNIPPAVDIFRVPSKEITLMKEWETKLEAIVKNTIDRNVTTLSGAPAWFLTLIKEVLKTSGKNSLLEVWPNLELFVHGGISFEPYREQYKQLIPSEKMNYMEVYNASEGFFAIQDRPREKSMLLMLDYQTFYEFMPLEELGKLYPKTHTIEEVEIGKNYAMIISTSSGLWRYLIGDTVMFTSKYPYRIKVTGRTKYFINAFGEELIADNAEMAIAKTCLQTGAVVKEYTVAPVFMSKRNKGRHQWLIEFEKQPADIEQFADALDKNIQELNSDYEAKRYKSLTMERLQIIVVKDGGFYEWLKQRGKLGSQHKIPRLQNDRTLVEEILGSHN